MSTSTYPLDKLLTLWRRGDLTADQMVGHLLQHHIELEKRVRHLETASTTAPTRAPVDPAQK